MHNVLVLMDVNYGAIKIATLTILCCLAEELETRLGSSVSDSRCYVTTFVSMPSRLGQNKLAFS